MTDQHTAGRDVTVKILGFGGVQSYAGNLDPKDQVIGKRGFEGHGSVGGGYWR